MTRPRSEGDTQGDGTPRLFNTRVFMARLTVDQLAELLVTVESDRELGATLRAVRAWSEYRGLRLASWFDFVLGAIRDGWRAPRRPLEVFLDALAPWAIARQINGIPVPWIEIVFQAHGFEVGRRIDPAELYNGDPAELARWVSRKLQRDMDRRPAGDPTGLTRVKP